MTMRGAAALIVLALMLPSVSGTACALWCAHGTHHDASERPSAACHEDQESPAPQIDAAETGACHSHGELVVARLDDRQASPMASRARIDLAPLLSPGVTQSIRLSTFGPPHAIPPSAPLRI
jgi:hypothetical protein